MRLTAVLDIVRSALAHPVSYVVRHKETNRLIGVRLTSILRRPATSDTIEDSPFKADSDSTKITEIQRLLHTLEGKVGAVNEVRCTVLSIADMAACAKRRGLRPLLDGGFRG